MNKAFYLLAAAFILFATCTSNTPPSGPGPSSTETSENTETPSETGTPTETETPTGTETPTPTFTPNATATAAAGFIDNFEPFDMIIMDTFPGANMWSINTDMALYGGTSGPPDAGGSRSPASNCLAVTSTVTTQFGTGPFWGLLRIAAPLPGAYDMSGYSSLSLDWASSYTSSGAGSFRAVISIIGTTAGYTAVYQESLPGAAWAINHAIPFSSFAPEGLTPVADTIKQVGEVRLDIYYDDPVSTGNTGTVSIFLDNVRFKN